MRLRSTAPPTCLLTVKPNRAPSAWPLRRLASKTNAGVAHRAPPRTRRNSALRLSVVSRVDRFPWVAIVHHGDPQADSRLRPLARRRERTLRPPAVSMRLRNPWRRLRTSLLG